jgi:membrane-bound lytic murein transglycosylase A
MSLNMKRYLAMHAYTIFGRGTGRSVMAGTVLGFSALLLVSCAALPSADLSPAAVPVSAAPIAAQVPLVPPAPVPSPNQYPLLRPAAWSDLAGWGDDDLREAWPAWLQSCQVLASRPGWQSACGQATAVDGTDAAAIRAYFQTWFRPYQATNPDGSTSGMVTGYFEPIIRGDRQRTERARYPIYGVPPDLITVDMASLYPELKHMRLRGRLVDNRLIPYYSRGDIEAAGGTFAGQPIAWAEDPVELFYLQVQGSGRIALPDGRQLRIGYADQNGHPFRSIARLLIDRGELTAGQATIQGIKQWGHQNPDKLAAVLNQNPSYVFFRELSTVEGGPLGALGMPLTERRSMAVDPRYIPLGAPVFLDTSWPLSERPLRQLMVAQDTGGAIRGGVRVDFFWGLGDGAGSLASRMKQQGRKWVLLPLDYFPAVTARSE